MSPTVFQYKNYRFFFFSREELRRHVHVRSPEGEAKFWLEPEVELTKNHRLSQVELKELDKIVDVDLSLDMIKYPGAFPLVYESPGTYRQQGEGGNE